jgi:hypothetical protein
MFDLHDAGSVSARSALEDNVLLLERSDLLFEPREVGPQVAMNAHRLGGEDQIAKRTEQNEGDNGHPTPMPILRGEKDRHQAHQEDYGQHNLQNKRQEKLPWAISTTSLLNRVEEAISPSFDGKWPNRERQVFTGR